MRRTRDRPLVLLVVGALTVAGCSATSGAALPTTGKVGDTLQATGAQFTLVEMIPDPTQQLVTAVLSVHNTSTATANFSILSVISLLSDTAGHTYTPDQNTGLFVAQCQGTGFFAPLDPDKSVQGCVNFQVPPGTAPAQLELLVHPTLRWTIANAPPPGSETSGATGNTGNSGTGSGSGAGTGSGTGTGIGTGSGTGTGPAKKKPVLVPHPKKVRLHHPKRVRVHHPKKKKAA